MAKTANPDPRLAQVVDMLPADGSPILHTVWRQRVIDADYRLLPMTQAARRSGDVFFEVTDPDDPAGSLQVRRAVTTASAQIAQRPVARPTAPPGA